MGMHLDRGDGPFTYVNRLGWITALQEAVKYGWDPKGTEAPTIQLATVYEGRPEDWDGGYCWNVGQTVTEDDALGLAAALERAAFARPADRRRLEDLAEFCWDGEFEIW